MVALLLKCLFLGISALFGAAAGWRIRGAGLAKQQLLVQEMQLTSPPTDEPPAQAAAEGEKIDNLDVMIAQLQQLTTTVAADVGEHNTFVQEINDELTSGGATEASVLAVVERLVKANDAMQSQLVKAEDKLQQQAAEMETHVKEARTDSLTKLWNRRHFDDEMQKCKLAFQEQGEPCGVMMLDVDHFKKFNDTYGHQAGDEVLRGVARTLRQSVTTNEIVCRYGGEEFAIIFPGSDVGASISIGERARAAIAEQVFEFQDLDLRVTASGGLAQLQPEETAEELVKRADDALYVCKEEGRDCGYWHDGADSHAIALFQSAAEEENEPISFADENEAEDYADNIIGVSDRKSLIVDIERRIAEWKRGGSPLSVLLVEVDRYEAIIEDHGGKAGEVVLRAASQFLKAAMREMDHIARYEENAFGLLLPAAELMQTTAVAERLRTAIGRCTLPMNGEKLTFTVSLGAAQVGDEDDSRELLRRAEASLVASREAGGNSCFATMDTGEIRSMAFSG